MQPQDVMSMTRRQRNLLYVKVSLFVKTEVTESSRWAGIYCAPPREGHRDWAGKGQGGAARPQGGSLLVIARVHFPARRGSLATPAPVFAGGKQVSVEKRKQPDHSKR